MKKINNKELYLNQEEADILQAIDNGEYESVSDLKNERKTYSGIAREQLAERKAISIRLPMADIIGLKARASVEGVPYQTLIGSLVHKYIKS